MKAARRKLEVSMPAAMPCRVLIKSSGIGKRKTKLARIVDADESTRPRLERAGHKTSSRSHHFKWDGFFHSLQSCSQSHSDASSDEHSRCEGNSGRRMVKTGETPAWQLTKVRKKK